MTSASLANDSSIPSIQTGLESRSLEKKNKFESLNVKLDLAKISLEEEQNEKLAENHQCEESFFSNLSLIEEMETPKNL